jgi:spermidine/putrescine transport system permease protein
MTDFQVPVWGYWVMGAGLAAFLTLVGMYVKKNRGFKRPLFASPYVLWLALFTVIPCLLVAYFSFTDPAGNFTLDNFKNFWDSNYNARKAMDPKELESYLAMGLSLEDLGLARNAINIDTLVFSLWMAFLCTVICLVLAYPTALFMADRRMKRASSLVILFVVPMWMNITLRTYAMRILMVDDGPLITFLRMIGFGDAQLMDTPTAVLIGMVYNFLPFMIFPIYTVLSKMDPALQEAAADLGASPGRSLVKVTMPLSIPGVVSGITMVFMPAVTTFTLNVMLGGSKRLMLGNLIEQTFTKQSNWNMGSAMSLVMMVLILISLTILRKADPNNEGGGM